MKRTAPWLVALALALLMASAPAWAQGDVSNGNVWSPVDASNNQTPPSGWPAGMAPNQVEPTARAMMGAIKRWWERSDTFITTGGTANVQTYTPTNTTYPAVSPGYIGGECWTWAAGFTNTSSATLNVNALGAKTIKKGTPAGIVALTGGEIVVSQTYTTCYNGTDMVLHNGMQPGMVLIDTQTASNSGSLNFVTGYSSLCSSYIFDLVSVIPATDAQNLKLRISQDSGANWKAGSTDYRYGAWTVTQGGTGAGSGDGGGASSMEIAANLSNGSTAGISGRLQFYNLASAAVSKQANFDLSFKPSGGTQIRYSGMGSYVTDQAAINGVQFFMGSGNLTSGAIKMYCVRG